MDNYTKELIKKAHDVKCPACGTQASVRFYGDAFESVICCHEEVKKLVDDRLDRMNGGSDESKYFQSH